MGISWASMRTGFLVSAITLAVWIFAEAESLRTRVFNGEVVFIADAASGRVVEVADGQGWRGRVQVWAEGTASGLDKLDLMLQRRALRLKPGDDGVPTTPGEANIDLRLALREHPDLGPLAAGIIRVEPASVKVIVDEIVTQELGVSVLAPEAELAQPPVANPPSVRLRAPSRLLSRMPGGATAQAVLDAATLSKLMPGRSETLQGVPLTVPGLDLNSGRVQIEPGSADVTLELRSRNSSLLLDSVPVLIRIAPGEYGRWTVELAETDRFLTDVRVSGPGELISQIQSGVLNVSATLSLSYEELERGITSKEVAFGDYPSPLRFEAENRLVRFTIRKR